MAHLRYVLKNKVALTVTFNNAHVRDDNGSATVQLDDKFRVSRLIAL
jgi:hypothetical protein